MKAILEWSYRKINRRPTCFLLLWNGAFSEGRTYAWQLYWTSSRK